MNGEKHNGLAGTWRLEKSENFEEYMKAVEVGFMMRKLGATVKPNVVISVDDDTWTLKTVSALKTHELVFKIGEEFEETTVDGRKVQTVITLDGSGDNAKLVQKQSGNVPSTITRELIDNGEGMICTCVAKDVTSKRYYKRES